MAERILAPVSPGELIDKITILEIKAARIADAAKVANVKVELDLLSALRDEKVAVDEAVETATRGLKDVNEKLWDVEDRLREMEAEGEFGPAFVEAARSVYKLNDRRAALKKDINVHVGSDLVEEKSYAHSK